MTTAPYHTISNGLVSKHGNRAKVIHAWSGNVWGRRYDFSCRRNPENWCYGKVTKVNDGDHGKRWCRHVDHVVKNQIREPGGYSTTEKEDPFIIRIDPGPVPPCRAIWLSRCTWPSCQPIWPCTWIYLYTSTQHNMLRTRPIHPQRLNLMLYSRAPLDREELWDLEQLLSDMISFIIVGFMSYNSHYWSII